MSKVSNPVSTPLALVVSPKSLRRACGTALMAAALLTTPLWAAVGGASSSIAWHAASSEAQVERALALARQTGKPVFLYWGAVWCPPCNQIKATLFSRSDFIERSKAFLAVYIDGDMPGAQKISSRFKVNGYPTMVLLKPDGTEITRLPGEVDPERYLLALTDGLNAQVPVKELMRRGLAGQKLTPEQWRLLAFYSWDVDEQQVTASAELPRRLAELASKAPAEVAQARDRLAFKALSARAGSDQAADASATDGGRALLDRVFADPAKARELADLLIANAESVVKYLAPPGEARLLLAKQWDASLASLVESALLSKGEQVDALSARVDLWKLMEKSGQLPQERRTQVLREIARLAAATTDKYERQAVIPSAAHVLAQAGMLDESDELLKFELPHAVAPYYHMLGLGSNARKRNDATSALSWYEQAWRKSEGPATRLQWGAGYVGHLVDLVPGGTTRVESAAASVIDLLAPKDETFHGRNQRTLKKMAGKLERWQAGDQARAAAVQQVRLKLAKVCSRIPAGRPGRANCESVFTPANS